MKKCKEGKVLSDIIAWITDTIELIEVRKGDLSTGECAMLGALNDTIEKYKELCQEHGVKP